MKEKLFEEFNYKIDVLTYHKEYISFFYNGSNYIIQETETSEQEIKELVDIVSYLENYRVYFHEIQKGINSYLFNYNNKNYILLKLRIYYNREITLNEIIYLSSIDISSLNIKRVVPALKMSYKIDFLEQYIANYEKSYNLEDFSYYLGLSETGILLSNLIEVKNEAIGHKRLHKDEKTLTFYNPLNIILDSKCRDLAEYAKSVYFETGKNLIFDILKYIKIENWVIYFIRILYPSYYFDCLENIIINNDDIECQKKISSKANDFEKILKQLYNTIGKYVNLPFIEWLSNVDDF